MQSWVVICWAVLVLVGADECPDGGRCKEGQTCCSSPTSDGYKCCPFDQAECCEDHIHCCPAGTACNAETSSCVNATASVPWAERISADQTKNFKSFRMIKTSMDEDYDTVCADKSRCPAEFSCVKGLTKFGCCPVAKGVSCSDGKHCCPEGHHCSIDSRSCIKEVKVPCNETAACPNGTTCCKIRKDEWTCCPFDKAVCCKDRKHCCPHGNKCNPETKMCEDDTTSVPWAEKIPTIPREDVLVEVKDVLVEVKDDKCNITCPEATTCCPKQTSGWFCCSIPNAVCCNDSFHCCPSGRKCNLVEMTCDAGPFSEPMLTKIPSIPREEVQQNQLTVEREEISAQEDDNDEEDDYDGEEMDEDEYDGEEMDEDDGEEKDEDDYDGEEDDGEEEIPDMKNRTKCDNHTSCPHRTTCCFITSSKKWGCCPLRKAVCCSDGVHCCPARHKCKEDKASCTRDGAVIPWYTKIPATTSDQTDPSSVKCDNMTKCPRHTSCCKLSTGKWGCCPVKKAVCCHDKKHCCPRGYTCDPDSKSCKKEGLLETIPLTPVHLPEHQLQLDLLQLKDVKCDDQYSCPDGMTCCHNSPTTWACCPLPNAVCCSDFQHCCPSGTTCSGGSCIQNETPNWYNWKPSFANKKKAAIL